MWRPLICLWVFCAFVISMRMFWRLTEGVDLLKEIKACQCAEVED